MPDTVTPFLMFKGDAEAAMQLYCSLFDDAEVTRIEHYGADEAGQQGTVERASLQIGAQSIMCIDSPVEHDFTFTPSFSLYVDCADAARFDSAFEGLANGGEVMMPPDNYGFSARFAWLSDRFGVSWQLNLAADV